MRTHADVTSVRRAHRTTQYETATVPKRRSVTRLAVAAVSAGLIIAVAGASYTALLIHAITH